MLFIQALLSGGICLVIGAFIWSVGADGFTAGAGLYRRNVSDRWWRFAGYLSKASAALLWAVGAICVIGSLLGHKFPDRPQ
jgi:hypothetical protein